MESASGIGFIQVDSGFLNEATMETRIVILSDERAEHLPGAEYGRFGFRFGSGGGRAFGLDLKAGQHEIPVVASGCAFCREALVNECLKPDGSNLARIGFEG